MTDDNPPRRWDEENLAATLVLRDGRSGSGRLAKLDPNQLLYGLFAMNAVFASLAWCLSRPSWLSMLSLAAFGALWPFANGPLEGHTLVSLGKGHGITASDLLSVLAAIVLIVQAGRLAARARKHSRSEG